MAHDPAGTDTFRSSRANFPFAPARTPLYYGWIVLVFGILGNLMSVPGQTVGVSVYTDFLIDALNLSRSTLSLAYLVGTITGSFLLVWAGRLYDRYGARVIGPASAALLAMVLLLLSGIDRVVDAVMGPVGGAWRVGVAFAAIAVGFFLLRFSGQGVLTLVSRNMVNKWFDRRRGQANALLGVFIAFGFSAAPRLLESLIDGWGWRGSWRMLAAAVAAFAVGSLVFYRDNPESCGLEPDGPTTRRSRHRRPPSHPENDFTLPEARRTFAFWAFVLSLALLSLYTTALTFHVVSIFEEAGMDRNQAVGIFLPASAIAVVFQFAAGWLSDYVKLKYFLLVQLVGTVLSAAGLIVLAPGLPVVAVITGNGIMGGIFGLLSSITWPKYYGQTHLGAISGFAMGFLVAGSAVGPYAFSLSFTWTGGYAGAAVVCLVVSLVLMVFAFWADRPRRAVVGR
jgi:MFS transporter, OFA family, oxalate/formate antiporter